MDLFKALIGSLLLLLLLPSALNASDSQNNDAAWAEAVDGKPLDLNDKRGELLEAREEVKKISKDVQELKMEVIELNKDLRLMEEELLFPSSTKYTVFLSVSSAQFLVLESVKLKLDGRLVATHIYSEKQRQALLRGGIHRLYVTNLNEGKHSATAFFTGIGPGGRAYKRAVSIDFEKSSVGKYLELAVGDDRTNQEPTFTIRQW